jgi:alkylhydroperoxidase family enzyme
MTRLSDNESEDQSTLGPRARADVWWRSAAALRPLAASPRALEMALANLEFMTSNSLPARLRELAILQVAVSTASVYEWAHHVEHGRGAGIKSSEIEVLGGLDFAGLDAGDRAVLDAARELTEEVSLRAETWATLRDRFTPVQIVDLLAVVAYYNGVARTVAALEVEVEVDLLPVLRDHPLPFRAMPT